MIRWWYDYNFLLAIPTGILALFLLVWAADKLYREWFQEEDEELDERERILAEERRIEIVGRFENLRSYTGTINPDRGNPHLPMAWQLTREQRMVHEEPGGKVVGILKPCPDCGGLYWAICPCSYKPHQTRKEGEAK